MNFLLKRFSGWNATAAKALWALVALGLIAAAFLAAVRLQTEKTSNYVQFVFDYRDLLEIAEYEPEREAFIQEQFLRMRDAGVGALAVYESTLRELELSGAIRLFTAKEAAVLSGDPDLAGESATYALFAGEDARRALEPVIREGFALFGIGTESWSHAGRAGLKIEAGSQEASIVPLDPDPLQMERIKAAGFALAVRLSDARPYDHARMDDLLGRLKAYGAETIIFAGKQVTGYGDDARAMTLTSMAELMKKHGLLFAVIEQPPARQQLGIGKLAYLTGYRVIRLHSILEEEAFNDARVLADRYILAIKDRNFRMIYLNARARVDRDAGTIDTPLNNLYASLSHPDYGAVKRIREMGLEPGSPEPFTPANPPWERTAKLLVMIGAVALIARMAGLFLPRLTLAIFAFGLVCTAGLYAAAPTIAVQALALLAAVSSPTAAVILAVHAAERKLSLGEPPGADAHAAVPSPGGRLRLLGWTLLLFAGTVALSLTGALLAVGLLNDISYMLAINLFRGVSVLHALPIALVAAYLMFFRGAERLADVWGRLRDFLLINVKVAYAAGAAVAAALFVYYMTRTGNQGAVPAFDREFRAFLENALGVRPRTKELIAHPLFIMGIYLWLRHRRSAALALTVVGTMAMLSVVDTFAHLHTPLPISALRVVYGMLIGACMAAVCVAVWELLAGGWNRWRERIARLRRV